MSTPELTAQRVMTPDVLGIVPSAPPEVALRMMVETGIRHLPVIDRGRCVGLLHEVDLLWSLRSRTGAMQTAGAVARSPVVTVAAGETVRSIARRMVAAATDAAVVVEGSADRRPADRQIVGIVTATDLLRRLASDQ